MPTEDKTLKDIAAGKGLKPLNTQSGKQSTGVTTEQRGQKSGIRIDQFTLQKTDDSRSKGN